MNERERPLTPSLNWLCVDQGDHVCTNKTPRNGVFFSGTEELAGWGWTAVVVQECPGVTFGSHLLSFLMSV